MISKLAGIQSRRQSSRIRGAKRLSGGGQSLKLSTKAAVFKRVSLLIGGSRPPLAPLGAGPAGIVGSGVTKIIYLNKIKQWPKYRTLGYTYSDGVGRRDTIIEVNLLFSLVKVAFY